MKTIDIIGAKTHNLKNIDISIPRNKLVVITGLSGSGKSSLAFDTIYAEGQRRYVESLSIYARQFLSIMDKPDVEHIAGLSPAISIEQKSSSHNPRSTVGTITEIYDYLRLLYARVGNPVCPVHKESLNAKTISEIVDAILKFPQETKIMVLAKVLDNQKGEQIELISSLKSNGYVRILLNDQIVDLSEIDKLTKGRKNTVFVVVDRLKIREENKQRIAESLEHADDLSEYTITIQEMDSKINHTFSTTFSCSKCNYSIDKLEPQSFSFNSPQGACNVCNGLGVEQYFDIEKMITNPNYSISEGAISRWSKRNMYYYDLISSVAKEYNFSCDTPFKDLSKEHQNILFNGSDDIIEFKLLDFRGRRVTKKKKFEGILYITKKRYNETDSNLIKEELAKFISNRVCKTCNGSRLKESSRNVFIDDYSISDINNIPIENIIGIIENFNLTGAKKKISNKITKEIIDRLSFLINVGLDYLNLARTADTLSGGEMQRIRLASQVGSGLVGVTYILDEPSIGLHQKDNDRLCSTLFRLRDLGNSVIVVEHDEDTILASDHVIDIGPRAGVHGGEVVAQGTPQQILNNNKSLTGQYLSGAILISRPNFKKVIDKNNFLKVKNVSCNNLKNINVDIPLGLITSITGVSGSGKSSLINETLLNLLRKQLKLTFLKNNINDAYLENYDDITNIINITQDPIGRTPRSNPATYTGVFSFIRELFAKTTEAKARGYKIGRFSFNVKGGRCEACQGDGIIKVAMHFLSDLEVKCDVCMGKKYNRESLEIKYKNKNIYEVLEMTIEEAFEFFKSIPSIANKLQTLIDVGLTYIQLGQNATTLSGGEAQRIKLSKELSKRETGNTLYILDEPTTGLHFHDISQLLKVIYKLRDKGNTIVIIEHNLDIISSSDWIIDLGPEGGHKGGELICSGPVEDIIKNKQSYTAKYLIKHIDNNKKRKLIQKKKK